jgi:hypothetical protein
MQFSGSPDSPDVVCDELNGFHFEVKLGQRHNIYDAMAQALSDCGAKLPLVAHRRNRGRWLVTMEAHDFFKLLRGEFDTSPQPSPPRGEGEDFLCGTVPLGSNHTNKNQNTQNV